MSDGGDHQDLRAKLNSLREVLKASEISDFRETAIHGENIFQPAKKAVIKELIKTP